jgi:UDPglucose 6-dehydrogenase
VKAYDPVAMEVAKKYLPGGVEYHNDLYSVADKADAVLLLTEWNVFKQVDWSRVKESMNRPVLFDGRNLYDPNEIARQGFQYRSVGRPTPTLD